MFQSIRTLLSASLLAASAIAAAPVAAQGSSVNPIAVSGSASLVTDYRFRGVSDSDGDPAVQAGVSASHTSGFYVGAWASSIDGGPLYGEEELDLYGGWSGAVAPGITLDAGLLKYVYPTNDVGPADYWEPYAAVSSTLGPARVKLGVAYAWNQGSLGGEDNLYVYTNVDVGIPTTPVTVFGHIGYTDGVLAPSRLAGGLVDTGLDYSIGATATVLGPLSVGLSYVGVNGPSVDGLTDDTLVGTLSISF